MTESKRYDRPFEVEFGGQTIRVAPIKGMEQFSAFQEAVFEEIHGFALRAEGYARASRSLSPEALLEAGVDQARLLKLALPGVITDELLAESTAKERAGLLTDVCHVNNLVRAVPFLLPEVVIDLMSKMNLQRPDFPLPESASSSSTSESTGVPSSAN